MMFSNIYCIISFPKVTLKQPLLKLSKGKKFVKNL